MKKRFLLFSIGLILISIVITSAISVNVNIKNFISEKETMLLTYSRIINMAILDELEAGREIDYEKITENFSEEMDIRLTFIDKKGNVLADSEMGSNYINMENHLGREEITEAILTGQGQSNRESDTFGTEYLYAADALKYPEDTLLITRVALEVDKLEIISDFILKTLLISSAIGILAASVIAVAYTNTLMKPINEMEEQLKNTMKENKKAEQIRKDFVANVTHELKTPLTSISGFVETLQDGAAEDPEIRSKFLDIIAIEAARLKRLIEDILIISDIENKRESNTDSDINVRESIEEILTSIGPIIEAKQVKIITSYAYEIYIGGNNDRFKQLMMNLIENAVKYSYDGGTVTITAEKKEGKIYISVKDEGIGISEEHLPRLFERFYRVDKSRAQKAGGTGLGLAIVKHIASLFEAEIRVQSELGKGSTFTVVFNN
ncbi:MAG: ATP-binding protein [Eubacteriales bacterium]|nr:ATP-binding protein [Eubacteriales bacterium]MDD3199007.1 ATP-binding protein [Eubacteriales bacterium]MDD4122015.1 ATP-binding protein [Eubacteriales bacterium]MDD4629507.1 ATP-binding protein [Eubacteriales bacterium]